MTFKNAPQNRKRGPWKPGCLKGEPIVEQPPPELVAERQKRAQDELPEPFKTQHAEANARRKLQGEKALRSLERLHRNGCRVDNLTDYLTNLLHAGLSPLELERARNSAVIHYTDESSPNPEFI